MGEDRRFENSLLRGIEARSAEFDRAHRTGWHQLDDETNGGMRRGQLWVVTGPAELRRAVTGAWPCGVRATR